MNILKFGGTSVGNPDSISAVAGIIREEHRRHGAVCVVASAFSKVTNQLIELARGALDATRPGRRSSPGWRLAITRRWPGWCRVRPGGSWSCT